MVEQYMKSFIGKKLLITLFLGTFTFVSLSVIAENNTGTKELDVKKTVEAAQETKSVKILSDDEFFGNEEKVVISIINFGRKNPFLPYVPPTGIKLNGEEDSPERVISLDDVPYPPVLQNSMNEQIQELMNSKVNGILYDPYAKSVAIVTIKGSEYMLHKGDLVHGILVDNIAENNITLKYGTNTYTVAVGEVMDGSINGDPVQRKERIFAGSDYDLPDINLEEYN